MQKWYFRAPSFSLITPTPPQARASLFSSLCLSSVLLSRDYKWNLGGFGPCNGQTLTACNNNCKDVTFSHEYSKVTFSHEYSKSLSRMNIRKSLSCMKIRWGFGEREPKCLPARKSFMSARKKECNIYSREMNPQRLPARK